MIEFSGYIFGDAEKRFYNKSINLGQNILLMAVIMVLPSIIILTLKTKNILILTLYCTLFVIIPLLVRVPKGKKEKQSIKPKRIYTEGESIVCVTDKDIVARLVQDVKIVYEFDEFYEIVFPFGKISDKFICQKCLLSKGTLEDFEELFVGKIIKKTNVRFSK